MTKPSQRIREIATEIAEKSNRLSWTPKDIDYLKALILYLDEQYEKELHHD